MIKLSDGSLRIFDLTVSDSGYYRCRAENQWGADESTTHVTRASQPRIQSSETDVDDMESMDLEVDVGSHVRARLGARVVIKCPTEGLEKKKLFDSTLIRHLI